MVPDIFDRVLAESPKGDIFDRVAAEQAKPEPDIFDRVAAENPPTPAPLQPHVEDVPVVARIKEGMAANDPAAQKTLSLFDPTVQGEMQPAFAALEQSARNGGVFGSPTLSVKANDVLGAILPDGDNGPTQQEQSKAKYDSYRDQFAQDFHLTNDEADDIVKHRLNLQKDDVSRDALGTVHIKDGLLAKGIPEIEKSVEASNLGPDTKASLIKELPQRVDLFKGSVVDNVRKNHPELAQDVGLTEKDDTTTSYKKITDALNTNAASQGGLGFAAGVNEVAGGAEKFFGKINDALPNPGGIFGEDTALTDRAKEVEKKTALQNSITDVSHQINQGKTELFGVNAATIGKGVASVGEAATIGAATGGLGDLVIPAAVIEKAGPVGAAALKFAKGAADSAPVAGYFGAKAGLSTYDEALKAGKSEDEARGLAATSAGINTFGFMFFGGIGHGGAAAAGAELASNSAKEIAVKTLWEARKDFVKGVADTTVSEPFKMAVITALDTVAVQAKLNPNMTVDDLKKSLYDTVVSTGIAGGLTGIVNESVKYARTPTSELTTPELELEANKSLAGHPDNVPSGEPKADTPTDSATPPAGTPEPVAPGIRETVPPVEQRTGSEAPVTTAPPKYIEAPSETIPSEPESAPPPAEESAPPEIVEPATKTEPPAAETVEKPVKSAPAPEEPSPTGMRNAIVDAERAKRGLPERFAPARQTNQEAWDHALAEVDKNPNAGRELVERTARDPQALTPDETALFTHEQLTREQAVDTALDAVNKATDETRADAVANAEKAETALAEVYDVGQRLGTKSGQSLQARKLLVNQDFSLARMLAREQAVVNQGKPLSEQQRGEVKALHDKITDLQRQISVHQERENETLAKQTFENAKKELKKASAESAQRGERRPSFIEKQAQAARDRIKARKGEGRLNSLPVDELIDHAIVGISYIAKGATQLAEFTARLVKDFGEDIRKFAGDIFSKSQELYGETNSVPSKIKSREDILSKVDAESDVTGKTIYDLAKVHINNGMTGFEEVMGAVLKDLQDTHPDITLRDVHDLYSGYGKVIHPSKAADKVALREYRALARLTSQLEDAQKGEAPLRTGVQRDKATVRVRTLQKQVKDTMRRLGIKSTSDEQQLRTSLDAVKSRLKNEIEELEVSIKNREPRPVNKSQVEYDAEAMKLKERRDALKSDYDGIFGKKEATVEEQVKAAEASLTRRIAEEEKLLTAGQGNKPRTVKPKLESERLTELRKSLDEKRVERKALQDPVATRLARDKKAILTRIAKIQDKIARADYSTPVKSTPVMDAEKSALQLQEYKAKRELVNRAIEAHLKQRTTARKIWDGVKEAGHISRALKVSIDFSATLRQGGILVAGNPLRLIKAFPKNFSGITEKGAYRIQQEIEANPLFLSAKKAGLFLAENHETLNLTKMEESYMGRLAKKIPGISHSENAAVSFLNTLRMNTFSTLARSLQGSGNLSEKNLRVIANFVNKATGRGDLGRFENAAEAMAAIFFSPKYVVSRFQILFGGVKSLADTATLFKFGSRENVAARKLVAFEYAKFLSGSAAFLGAIALRNSFVKEDDKWKIGVNPNSSDFLKIKLGNTRLDIMEGLSQATVLLSRLYSGKTVRGGKEVSIRGDNKAFGSGVFEIGTAFLRSKLSPVVGSSVNLVTGQDAVGNPVRPETEALGAVLPLSFGDIYSIMRDQGMERGPALSALSLLGVGVATYGKDVHNMDSNAASAIFGTDPSRYQKATKAPNIPVPKSKPLSGKPGKTATKLR